MEVSQELADRVLTLVSGPQFRPSKPRQIADALKLDKDEFRELKRVIKSLVLTGRLKYGPNHLVLGLAAASENSPDTRPADVSEPGDEPSDGEDDSLADGRVQGTFRRAMGGFGFVRLTGGKEGDESLDDIFIPPGATGGALDGDTVEVRLEPRARGGQGTEGVVDKILARGKRQFTGTFEMRGTVALVHLDGVPWDHPVVVGDVRGLPLEGDEKVFVELVQFPDEFGDGAEGVILEVLGKTNNPAVDTLTIMRQYGLPEEFPEEVLSDARRQADLHRDDAAPDDISLKQATPDRRDLTDLLTITIDPFDARDFDDAISLVKAGGRWTLWVHIADVSTFVVEGSPLDIEAQNRATSCYLPDRVVPMIPEIISNHLASLQPDRTRLTKTVEIEMLDDGVITSVEVYNSMIRSDMRLNYEQVDEFLKTPEAKREAWGDAICDLLSRMHKLAMDMRRRRFKRGSLTMDVPEVKIDLDKGGKVKGAHVVKHTESHQIIEEFMLAGNQAVATWLDDQELNFLHRIHPAPDRRKLRQLEQFARDIGLPVNHVESRFEIQRILDMVAGTALEDAVNFAVLRSMNKAVYGPHREGHYALDMEHYCHFTSPIRRYPDLTVHRLVQNVIDKKKTPDDAFPNLLRLGFHCSDQERNAASAERDLVLLKLLHFMKKQVGQTMDAVISRVFADGLFARCLQLPVEGFLPLTALPPDRYRHERRGQMIVGFKEGNQFRLGDRVTVKIAKVDLRERQLWMDFVKKTADSKPLPWRPPGSGQSGDLSKRRKSEKVAKKKIKKSRKRG
ncbi:MAG: ribonuclease R family protein [Planctomycetaceae bacterium]